MKIVRLPLVPMALKKIHNQTNKKKIKRHGIINYNVCFETSENEITLMNDNFVKFQLF